MQVAVMDAVASSVRSVSFTHISSKQALQKWEKLWPPSVAQLLTQLDMYGKAFTDNQFELSCLRVVGKLAATMLYEGADWLKYYMSVLRVFDGHKDYECPEADKEILNRVRYDHDLQRRILFLVVWEIAQFRSKEFMQQVHAYHLRYYCGVDR